MTIKNQIETLINSYREDFRKETGLELIAFSNTPAEEIKLEKLKKITEEYTGIPVGKGSTLNQMFSKRLMIRMAIEMGYSNTEISTCIGMNRTAILYYRNEGAAFKDIKFEKEYAKFKESIIKL